MPTANGICGINHKSNACIHWNFRRMHAFSFVQLVSHSCFSSRSFFDYHRTLHIHALAAYELSTAHRASFQITASMVIVTGKCIAVSAAFPMKATEWDAHILFSTMVHDRHPAAVRLHHILYADQAATIVLHICFLLTQRSDDKLSEVHTMPPPAGAKPRQSHQSHRQR